MTQRASLVGGLISFLAVIVLSLFSLDMVEGGWFFMQEMESAVVGPPPDGGDSLSPDSCEKILE